MTRGKRLADNYVLDALANDVEDLETVLRSLNSDTVLTWRQVWGREFDREEVIEALARLIRQDLVQAYELDNNGTSLIELPARTLPSGDFWNFWFGLTPRGRLVHQNWEPPLPPSP